VTAVVILLYVVGALAEGYAVYELLRQTLRARSMLQDPDFVLLTFDGGDQLDLTPESQDPDSFQLRLARNQESSAIVLGCLLFGIIVSLIGNLLSMTL
jgi:hypothetical protein